MKWIRSEVPHSEFISGRHVESAVSRPDDSAGVIVGRVQDEDVRDTDRVIVQQAYDVLVADIKVYNATIPPEPERPPTRVSILDIKLSDKTITLDEIMELLQIMRGIFGGDK